MKLLLFILSVSSVARAEVTVDQARKVACHEAMRERPPTFVGPCEALFREPPLVTNAFYLFQGYDENHECAIQVHVYRADGHPVVHSDCD